MCAGMNLSAGVVKINDLYLSFFLSILSSFLLCFFRMVYNKFEWKYATFRTLGLDGNDNGDGMHLALHGSSKVCQLLPKSYTVYSVK